jgi:hypothetical protein
MPYKHIQYCTSRCKQLPFTYHIHPCCFIFHRQLLFPPCVSRPPMPLHRPVVVPVHTAAVDHSQQQIQACMHHRPSAALRAPPFHRPFPCPCAFPKKLEIVLQSVRFRAGDCTAMHAMRLDGAARASPPCGKWPYPVLIASYLLSLSVIVPYYWKHSDSVIIIDLHYLCHGSCGALQHAANSGQQPLTAAVLG